MLFDSAVFASINLLPMAHLLTYDPSTHFSKAFSKYPSLSSSEVRRGIRFTLRGCYDASGSVNGNRVFLKKENTKGFSYLPRPPLLGGLEKGTSVRDDGRDANHVNVEHGSPGGNPAIPFCFPDQQASQKLVVAVDVDEGMYPEW